ncbi:hypothetical protein ['Paenibacillus yunnanensis' Narsing Rao et al. 2020]|uniref:hypothetical protein n=1 Tax=Paenibacillus tengchongensis TaxID=2608684 RepID=UPI001651DF5B|nr:hypothetical protein [Paenibacillus tengchongensis]
MGRGTGAAPAFGRLDKEHGSGRIFWKKAVFSQFPAKYGDFSRTKQDYFIQGGFFSA